MASGHGRLCSNPGWVDVGNFYLLKCLNINAELFSRFYFFKPSGIVCIRIFLWGFVRIQIQNTGCVMCEAKTATLHWLPIFSEHRYAPRLICKKGAPHHQCFGSGSTRRRVGEACVSIGVETCFNSSKLVTW